MTDPEPVNRMTVRFPLDLYAALVAWAQEDGRSIHKQVIYLLRRALREWRNEAK
jgi:hypothetical protein